MEQEILYRMGNDDQNALTIIYQRYWEQLYKVAVDILKDEETAEDVIHDVFVNIWNIRKKIQIQTSLRSYLQSCVRYACYEKIRKQKHNAHVELTTASPDLTYLTHCTMELKELQKKLEDTLNTMPRKSQFIFRMSRDEDMSYIEIAKKMNLSIKSIEYHISKVLRELRNAIMIVILLSLFDCWSNGLFLFLVQY